MSKLNNQYTLNFDNDIKSMIEKLADYYQRKPAELLRLLLIPSIMDQYAKLNIINHPENTIFKKL